jgi:type I restriction enzyme S subunit
LPCIRYGELYTRYNEIITSAISSTNLLADDLVLSQENDVIIPASGETQEDIAKASCILKSGIALGGDLNIIRSNLNGVFLALYLTNIKKKDIAQLAQGISVVHLYSNQLKKLSIHVPPIAEQQKIAAALSSFQDLIDAESKKLDALQEHKRGLMQGLFPTEGETLLRLRFPKFQQAGEWKERKLGDVCKMQAGKFVSAAEIFNTKQDGLFPCYGGNGLRGYTKSYTHDGKYSLIGRQGALCGNVTLAKGKFHATEHAVVVTPKNGVDTDWLYYQLNLSNLNQHATGQAQPGLSVENLEKVKILVPVSELEQEKIASCLSSTDTLIRAQQKKLKSLQLHKKALMQSLFPILGISQS